MMSGDTTRQKQIGDLMDRMGEDTAGSG